MDLGFPTGPLGRKVKSPKSRTGKFKKLEVGLKLWLDAARPLVFWIHFSLEGVGLQGTCLSPRKRQTIAEFECLCQGASKEEEGYCPMPSHEGMGLW